MLPAEPPTPAHPWPMALLRHDLPDGSHHFDWLLGQDAGGTRPLVAFRVQQRIDLLEGEMNEPIELERIADHRPAWLIQEGAVSGERGRVVRLCRGRIQKWERDQSNEGERWVLAVVWDAPAGEISRVLTVERQKVDRWLLFWGSAGRSFR